jgi:hypothetical protein
MSLRRTSFALAVFLGLAAVAAAAPEGTKAVKPTTKAPQHQHLHGVVVEVHHDKAKGTGEIKIKVAHHHKKKTAKSAAAAATPSKKKHHDIVTVHVTGATKFEKVIHSQGKAHRHKVSFADVHKDEHVRVVLSGEHHAREVDIEVHMHNKKVALPKTPPVLKPKKTK